MKIPRFTKGRPEPEKYEELYGDLKIVGLELDAWPGYWSFAVFYFHHGWRLLHRLPDSYESGAKGLHDAKMYLLTVVDEVEFFPF